MENSSSPFGLKVQWYMEGRDGVGVVIGTMSYDKNVWCVATEETIGMPLHREYCRFGNQYDTEMARELRRRYTDKHGTHHFNETDLVNVA